MEKEQGKITLIEKLENNNHSAKPIVCMVNLLRIRPCRLSEQVRTTDCNCARYTLYNDGQRGGRKMFFEMSRQ